MPALVAGIHVLTASQGSETWMAGTSPAMTAKRPSLHHFFRRARAPQVRGRRIFRPHLRPLRVVAMPGARLEIAELFVLHQIEFAKQLGDQSIRAAVIGEQIVPDAM